MELISVKSLLNKGFKIHVFDNLSTGNINNLPLDDIDSYNFDLKNTWQNWPNINASRIYHLAANADVRGGIKDHNVDFHENLLVTKNVCDYSIKNKIGELVFASSATVFGEPNIYPTPKVLYLIRHLYGLVKFLVKHLFKLILIMATLNLQFLDLFHGQDMVILMV